MPKTLGIACSRDAQIISLCENIGACAGLEWQSEASIVDFLLALQGNEFRVLLFDCDETNVESVKWVTFIRLLRPRIPLIVISNHYSKENGAKLLEQGVFYICQRPVSQDVLAEVVASAIKQFHQKK